MAFSVVEQPKSPNPFTRVLWLRRAANAGQGGGCEDGTRLEAAGVEAVVSQHFLSCPAWFASENLQVPPAKVAAAPTLGLPEASKRPGATQSAGQPHCPSCRLPLPLLNAQSPRPCPTAPCLAVCTVCIALRKEGTVERDGEDGARAGSAPISQPGPASPSSLPFRSGKGVVFTWEVFLPTPSLMSLVEQVLLGGSASNLHT